MMNQQISPTSSRTYSTKRPSHRGFVTIFFGQIPWMRIAAAGDVSKRDGNRYSSSRFFQFFFGMLFGFGATLTLLIILPAISHAQAGPLTACGSGTGSIPNSISLDCPAQYVRKVIRDSDGNVTGSECVRSQVDKSPLLIELGNPSNQSNWDCTSVDLRDYCFDGNGCRIVSNGIHETNPIISYGREVILTGETSEPGDFLSNDLDGLSAQLYGEYASGIHWSGRLGLDSNVILWTQGGTAMYLTNYLNHVCAQGTQGPFTGGETTRLGFLVHPNVLMRITVYDNPGSSL